MLTQARRHRMMSFVPQIIHSWRAYDVFCWNLILKYSGREAGSMRSHATLGLSVNCTSVLFLTGGHNLSHKIAAAETLARLSISWIVAYSSNPSSS